MLDCFMYEGLTEAEARALYFLQPRTEGALQTLVSYEDTPCFELKKTTGRVTITPDYYLTLVITKSGEIKVGDTLLPAKRGETYFLPYGCGTVQFGDAEAILCYPPKIKGECQA